MALKIRLRQQGRRNRLFYRIVVADSRSPRDGKFLEILGWYDPYEEDQAKGVSLKEERLKHWLFQGAVITDKVKSLAKRAAPDVMTQYIAKTLENRKKKLLKKKEVKKKAKEVSQKKKVAPTKKSKKEVAAK